MSREGSTSDWPRIDVGPTGVLFLVFETPGEREHPDWLRVRNWLVTGFGARFTRAFEYPTFEWYAEFKAMTAAGRIIAQVWWHDFPDQLTLHGMGEGGNEFVGAAAERLAATRPELGTLQSMDRRQWRRWMVSLGSSDYGT